MSQMQYPYINGQYPSFANVEVRVAGKTIGGITEINYTPKNEPGKVRGAGSQVIGFTVGQADNEGDFSMLEPQYLELLDLLGDNYMLKSFDIIVDRSPIGSTTAWATYQDRLEGCRITASASSGSTSSGDALVKKVTLAILRIYEDGKLGGQAQPVTDI